MDPLSIASSGQGYGRAQQPSTASPDPTGQTPPAPATETTGAPAERQAIKLPEDRVTLSGRRPETSQEAQQSTKHDPTAKEPKPGEQTTPDGKSVEDPQVKQAVERLKQIEEKVKAHEAAHKSAGGNLASSASYSYTQGPDGRSYITGGEVQIDMSPGKTPQETISKMQQVIRAALAPADPSGQDRAVAAQAANQMTQAQQQKMETESPTAEPPPGERANPTEESTRQALQPQQQAREDAGQPGQAQDVSQPTGHGTANQQARQAYGDPSLRQQPPTTSGRPETGNGPYATQQRHAGTGIPALSSYA